MRVSMAWILRKYIGLLVRNMASICSHIFSSDIFSMPLIFDNFVLISLSHREQKMSMYNPSGKSLKTVWLYLVYFSIADLNWFFFCRLPSSLRRTVGLKFSHNFSIILALPPSRFSPPASTSITSCFLTLLFFFNHFLFDDASVSYSCF